MQYHVQGWKKTLLFLLVFILTGCLDGCSGRREVYLAGNMSKMNPETAGQEPAEAGDVSENAEAQNAGGAESSAGSGVSADPGISVGAEASGSGGAGDFVGAGMSGGAGASGSGGEENSAGPEISVSAEASGSGGAGDSVRAGMSGGAEAVSVNSRTPAGYVYVCGAVAQPGVYPMYEGMRVFEAIALAGGFSQEADREWLNQAETVQDGERLYVYTQEETQELAQQTAGGSGPAGMMWAGQAGDPGAGSPQSGQTGMAASDGQKVNLNTADRETLKTLPGIGDAKADAIIQYRETYGSFTSIEDIQKISGIKSAVFNRIKDLIVV